MRRRTTTSQLRTSTKAIWKKRGRRTKKPSSSSPTIRSSNRTTNCSRKSMTAQLARTRSCAVAVVMATAVTAACTNYYEIPIETPIRPKLDVSAFQRVLVAGFIAGGTEDVDGNLETTRLLRSQLRTKSEMRVIDTDVLPLMDVASETRATSENAQPNEAQGTAPGVIKEDADLEPYEHVFADVEYWKRIGEEYQQPLIVTGTVMFAPQARSGIVQRDQEVYDSLDRKSTRLNSSHGYISYAVFCLKKKKTKHRNRT